MNKWLLTLLLPVLTLGQAVRADDPTESYADAHARAIRLDGTAEGKTYAQGFSKAIAPIITGVVRNCVAGRQMPDAIDFVLILDADGSVRRVIPAPWQPVTPCVAARFEGMKLPPPPRPNWPASVSVAIK